MISTTDKNNKKIRFVEVSDEPIHKEFFKNKYIRIYIADIPPGKGTQYHRHSRDTIYIVLEGGIISTEVVGKQRIDTFRFPKSFSLLSKLKLGIGSIIFGSMKLSKTFFFIMFHKDLPVVHKAIASNENLNDMKLMGIELIKPYKDKKLMPLKSKYFQIDFETNNFRVYRLNLEPGQSTGLLEYDFPGLLIAVNGIANIERSGTNLSAMTAFELKCGEFGWYDCSTVQNLLNSNQSKKRFEAIIIALG
jgi:hypothetical protein